MKVLIVVEDGLVQDVYSDQETLEVRVLDLDVVKLGDDEEYIEDNADLLDPETHELRQDIHPQLYPWAHW